MIKPGMGCEFKWRCPVCGAALSMPTRYMYKGMSMLCAKCAHAENLPQYYFSFAAGVLDDTTVEIERR